MVRRLILVLVTAIGLAGPSSLALADIAFIVVLKVPDANQEKFDALASSMVKASRQDDGLLIYEFARVGERVYGYERYANDAAHERHQALIEPFLPELTRLAEFEAIITLTPISKQVRTGLEEIGALIGEPIAGVAQGELGN